MLRNDRRIIIVHAAYILILTALVLESDTQVFAEGSHPVVWNSIPLTIMCSNQPGRPGNTDCYQVYKNTLDVIPLVVQIRMHGRGTEQGVPLATRTENWSDFAAVRIDTDRRLGIRMKTIADSSRCYRATKSERHGYRLAEAIPQELSTGDYVSTLFRITDLSGGPLGPGVYQITGYALPGAEEFFGARVETNLNFTVTVKESGPGDENGRCPTSR